MPRRVAISLLCRSATATSVLISRQIRMSSLLATHSYLPRICSICISFLVAFSFIGASKAQSSVYQDTVAQTKQVAIVTKLRPGKVAVAYSGSVSIHGNSSGYQYSVSSGALRTGLRLNANTGAVSGTPTKAETSYLELQAARASGPVATLQTQITISGTRARSDHNAPVRPCGA